MKIAVVHDYIVNYGGSERCFDIFIELLNPDVYTLFYEENKTNIKNVNYTFLNMLKKINYKYLLPLFPLAVKTFNLKNYDLIISSSHAWVKNIGKPKNSLHICYCQTPMRYAWDLKDFYLKNETKLTRPFASLFLSWLRRWDYKNTKNVDYFIANSRNVQDRIKRYYNRNSIIIYPPVDTKFFRPLNKKTNDNFYLIVSRLINHKRIDIAIKAFNKLNKKLIIIGSGREENYLKSIAKNNIQFLGSLPDEEILEYYQRCKAFLFCGEDDFGITPVEAQSCGKPVITYSRGGALESVIEGKTGHFFHEQTPESLIKAVREFENMKFSPRECRKNALKFDREIFKKKIKSFIEEKYREFKNAKK